MAKRRRRGTGLFLVKAPKTGIYQIRGTVLGKPVRESTRTTDLGRAEQIRLRAETNLHSRQLNGPQAVATFGEAALDYLDAGGESRFIGPLNDFFGDTLLRDIDQTLVNKFIRRHYPKTGPAGVNRQVYTPLIAILRLAARNKKCSLPSLQRPKIEKKMVEPAPDEWIADFLARCRLRNLKAICWFLTTTGVRVAEACRLSWQFVNLDKGEATIVRTKTGKPRLVPLDPDLVTLLREMEEDARQAKYVNNLVFRYGSKYSVNQAIERECAKYGMRYYSTHKLGRHAMATRLLNSGHTLKEVQEAGGWDSYRMVAEVYGHLERKAVHGAMLNVAKGLGTANLKQTNDNHTPAGRVAQR